MNTTQRITEIENEIADFKMEVEQLMAKIRGGEIQLALLKAGSRASGQLAKLPRTEAIASVLRVAGGTLSPTEILTKLSSSGRDEDLRKVTATLDYLLKRGLIKKASRGRYLAV